jgi:hypothetical protein
MLGLSAWASKTWYDADMAAIVLSALALVLHLAIAVVLVRKYLRTSDIGFVWLGVAVVIWPLVSRLLEHGELVLIDRLVKGQPVGYFPFSLVERGQMSIGGLMTSLNSLQQVFGVGLLLVAVVYLYKTKSNSNQVTA